MAMVNPSSTVMASSGSCCIRAVPVAQTPRASVIRADNNVRRFSISCNFRIGRLAA